MPTLVAAGLQHTSLGNEIVLTSGAGKTFVMAVNTSNMRNGDLVVYRVKTRVSSLDPYQPHWIAAIAHGQVAPNKTSIPTLAPAGAVFTVQQYSGALHTIRWGVYAID